MNADVLKALNDQINAELHAAYIYLSMAAYFEDENLGGFGHWMRQQSSEEMVHAMKIFDYVIERGGRVTLEAIDAPPTSFASPLDVFKAALAHEQKVTGLIHDLYGLAVEHKDYPTQVMLQWFIEEQVEEEDTAGSLVAQLEMAGDSPAALLVFDRQLAARGAPGAGAHESRQG